jgi:DnaK suppressor protein
MRAMRVEEITKVRRRLEEEHAGKLMEAARLARRRLHDGWPPETRSGDEADLASASIDEQLEHLQLRRLTTTVRSIDAALRTMAGGRYGRCLFCEEPIPARRLRAQPAAVLCLDCQGRAEAVRSLGEA